MTDETDALETGPLGVETGQGDETEIDNSRRNLLTRASQRGMMTPDQTTKLIKVLTKGKLEKEGETINENNFDEIAEKIFTTKPQPGEVAVVITQLPTDIKQIRSIRNPRTKNHPDPFAWKAQIDRGAFDLFQKVRVTAA